MLDYSEIIYSSDAFKVIAQDASSGRISHAYLFVSEDENYLSSFSEIIAKLLINLNDKEHEEKNNLRIEKHIHPDVKLFGIDKIIDAETANTIVDASNYSPFESDKKIFVLWNAHQMNESSQNKILKTIEEPPQNTYYLICCKNTSKLLQTIMSRVKRIDLDKLSANQICDMMIKCGVESEKAIVFSRCANGNGSYAEKLATEDGFIEFYKNIVNCFFEINGSRDILKYTNIFSGKDVDKQEFLNIVIMIARDIMMIISKREDFVLNKNVLAKLKVISSMLTLNALNEIIDECLKQKQNLEFNVNGVSIVDSVLFKIAEVKVKCRRL